MMSLVGVFEGLIHSDWRIERIDSNWHVREHKPTSNPDLKISGAKAFGFSLDQSGRMAWPFMQALAGMHKVCDAIIIAEIDDAPLVIAVELKSGNIGTASRQIHSTWLFMEWLRTLLEYHSHWPHGWMFCGLISSTPRRQEHKGTTHRNRSFEIDKSGPYPVAKIRNRPNINLRDLHKELSP
ncbi:MAG: hypothetical protein JSR64_05745 [Nitrospira sp.]|uniref:hypothetical protein n=2 Tax=Pseudomonadota TaxID=1224 RepID=UPI001D992367|nr:hypothetical protein [Plasticicumulans sp.]MBS0173520.1 hypothetical protein [Nitrospira sp.]HMW28830.1 hypothetical protein [Plasticicumulans sp.]HNG88130.1 hypothetical protein [Accumulibacter sp.]HNM44765.1 hypothetical protein [Plasticicumulans sp.]